MLIQLVKAAPRQCLVTWKENETKAVQTMWNQRLLCPKRSVSTTTSLIKLLHLTLQKHFLAHTTQGATKSPTSLSCQGHQKCWRRNCGSWTSKHDPTGTRPPPTRLGTVVDQYEGQGDWWAGGALAEKWRERALGILFLESGGRRGCNDNN